MQKLKLLWQLVTSVRYFIAHFRQVQRARAKDLFFYSSPKRTASIRPPSPESRFDWFNIVVNLIFVLVILGVLLFTALLFQ